MKLLIKAILLVMVVLAAGCGVPGEENGDTYVDIDVNDTIVNVGSTLTTEPIDEYCRDLCGCYIESRIDD
jgi:hypothetical protein